MHWRANCRTTQGNPGTMNYSLRAAVSISLLSLAACTDQGPAPWHDEAGYRWRELRVKGGDPGFTRVEASRSGIDFRNTVSESSLVRNRYLGQGAGISIGDVDGDGRPDIFL